MSYDYKPRKNKEKGNFCKIYLKIYTNSLYLRPQYRGVEQLVARRAHNPKVAGSSPASATK